MKKHIITIYLASLCVCCFSQNNKFGSWHVAQGKDQFGELTNEKVITGVFYGTFSNTATTNSELRVEVQIYENALLNCYFYEYNDNHKANLPDVGEIKFTTRLSNNQTQEIVQNVGSTYTFDSPFNRKFLKFLTSQKETVKVLVDFELGRTMMSRNTYSGRTKYLFEINPDGLIEALQNALDPKDLKKILK